MDDEAIIKFLCISDESPEFQKKALAEWATPELRKLLDKMQQIEVWDKTDGIVPLPEGVLVDGPRMLKRAKFT